MNSTPQFGPEFEQFRGEVCKLVQAGLSNREAAKKVALAQIGIAESGRSDDTAELARRT